MGVCGEFCPVDDNVVGDLFLAGFAKTKADAVGLVCQFNLSVALASGRFHF